MPTTTKTIAATSSPTTPDYSTLQSWEDASTVDLAAAAEIWLGQCLDQGTFTGTLLIDGHTTDANGYLNLTCGTGASFADKAGVRTTALRFNTANGVSVESNIPITISDNFTRVRGIQARNNSGYHTAIDIAASVENCRVDDFIAKNGTGSSNACVMSRMPSNVFANGLIENASAGNNGVMSQGQLYNCTIVNNAGSPSGIGATSGYSSLKMVNCAIFGFGTSYSGTAASGSGFNATDKAETFGSNCLQSLTYANQFENSTNDWRAISTGNLQAGTPDATNAPDDISGQDRDDTTPWIGCWEVAGGGGGMAGYFVGAGFLGGRVIS